MKPVNHVAELLKCGPSHDSETKLIGAQLSDGGTSGRRDLETIGVRLWRSKSLRQFIKFCIVGGSGLFVDMGILYLLADLAKNWRELP